MPFYWKKKSGSISLELGPNLTCSLSNLLSTVVASLQFKARGCPEFNCYLDNHLASLFWRDPHLVKYVQHSVGKAATVAISQGLPLQVPSAQPSPGCVDFSS